jgi:hypothetical protein
MFRNIGCHFHEILHLLLGLLHHFLGPEGAASGDSPPFTRYVVGVDIRLDRVHVLEFEGSNLGRAIEE